MNIDYLLSGEVCRLLDICKNTLYAMEKAGTLIPDRHPITNYRRYKRSDVDKILKKIERIKNEPNRSTIHLRPKRKPAN